MQEKQLDLKLVEMLNTPVCKMDGKDLVYLTKVSQVMAHLHNLT